MSPVVIRSNPRGTVNRGQVRRLIEEGRVEARVEFRYDDMDQGSAGYSGDVWMPCVVIPPHGDNPPDGTIGIHEDTFTDSVGRAYLTEGGKLRLKVHANLIYALRVRVPEVMRIDLPGLRQARSALAQHGGLLSAALRDLVERRPKTHAPSTLALIDMLDALDHVIERDFRSGENRGTS